MERRSKARIRDRFSTTVRGRDRNGQKFLTETTLENLSAGGLYLCIPHEIEEGAKLLFIIQFSGRGAAQKAAPRVAVHGKVLRSEPKPDGRYGLAIKIEHHRLL